MNMLAGAGDDRLFRISNAKDPCTQGVDLSRKVLTWSQFHKMDDLDHKRRSLANASSEPRPHVAFVDVEGQGAWGRDGPNVDEWMGLRVALTYEIPNRRPRRLLRRQPDVPDRPGLQDRPLQLEGPPTLDTCRYVWMFLVDGGCADRNPFRRPKQDSLQKDKLLNMLGIVARAAANVAPEEDEDGSAVGVSGTCLCVVFGRSDS